MDYPHWLTFLLVSVLAIIVLYYASQPTQSAIPVNTEHFTVTPTYIGDDFQQTVVAPLFAEEWRVPPPAYDMYSNDTIADVAFIEEPRPQTWPYGQVLSSVNFSPSDAYTLNMNPTGGAKEARSFANNLITRNEMASREQFTRIFKKTLQSRFRHNTSVGDTFSPFTSY
jgi:hypothetical protein